MDLDVQSYSLGHLGIVAGIFDTLKIGEVIDEVMPKKGSKKSFSLDHNKSHDP